MRGRVSSLSWQQSLMDGKAFVQATYKLESDACLIFTACSMLQKLATAASQRHCPKLRHQAEKHGKTPAEVAALEKYGKDRLQTGIIFFLQKFNVQFGNVVCAFKAMRLTCPNAIQNLKPDPAAIEDLHLFPFLCGRDDQCSSRRTASLCGSSGLYRSKGWRAPAVVASPQVVPA